MAKAHHVEQPQDPQPGFIGGPPQGITPRLLDASDPKGHHPLHKHVPLVDPASLMRPDGQHPFLAVPIPGPDMRPTGKWRIRQVDAQHAALMLSCSENGQPPTCRLATDAEIEAWKAEHDAAFAKRREKPPRQQ